MIKEPAFPVGKGEILVTTQAQRHKGTKAQSFYLFVVPAVIPLCLCAYLSSYKFYTINHVLGEASDEKDRCSWVRDHRDTNLSCH